MIMQTVELQISLILLFALAGYVLSSRINQSAVTGLIIIGMLIGPGALSIVKYTDAIKMLASLGSIILVFSIGLEFKIREIYKLKYLLIALFGIICPWAAGYLLGYAFHYNFRESMFIGVSLTATSIAITAAVLQEMKKLNTPVAKAIIGAAVIDDILGLLALSITLQSVKEGTPSILEILTIAIKSSVFLAAGIISARHVKKTFNKLDDTRYSRDHPYFLFMTSIMFCFLYASLAEIVGLSAIVGAFLAGAALEGVKAKTGEDLKKGAEYLRVVFGAIFFISLGILADIRGLRLGILLFFAVFLILAILTKVAGCGIASRLAGFGKSESLIIGLGMSPRGEVSMIIALIGLTSNSINQDIYVSIVMMSLMTTMITPLMLKKLK